MSFASAFLSISGGDSDLDTRVEANLDAVLQAVVPEVECNPALVHVRQSNLAFGVPMSWALTEGRESRQTRTALKARISAFEPRLAHVSDIELVEDEHQNSVTFRVAGRIADGTSVDLETKLSRLDQKVKEGQ